MLFNTNLEKNDEAIDVVSDSYFYIFSNTNTALFGQDNLNSYCIMILKLKI
jgi:hypothetical protein